jgi:hypothetical protein
MSKTDLEIVLDYILDYGVAGDFAYEAALRLKEDMEMVRKMRIDARAKCQAAHSEETANA